MDINPQYMSRALQLAAIGRYNASPNPMVGAVIVDATGKIIGEGYHRCCGEGHAEVNAVASVKNRDGLCDSTMYVTLEPCSHYGKTPPCANLIIQSGIKRVVVGCLDPFEKVSGRGVQMLRDAGVEVEVGVLKQECEQLNVRFFTAHKLRRPYVVLKWAQSKDGFMDHDRSSDANAKRFSTPLTSMLVHQLRAQCDAIMVGSNTIIADRPKLNTRLWGGRSPRVVIVDRRNRVAELIKELQFNRLLYLASKCDTRCANLVEWIEIDGDEPIVSWLHKLYEHGITSLLVEGGATLLKSFVDCGVWDVARVETAPFDLNQSGRCVAPSLNISPRDIKMIDGNKIEVYFPDKA